MNEAHVFFSGYVATDPVYWQNQDGNAKAQLRVAYTPRHVDRSTGEWTDNPTSFVTVVCWRKLADNVAMCVHKGDPVVVRGRMQVRQYDDRAGNPRLSVNVDASAIGHDLAKGVALFQRTQQAGRGRRARAGHRGAGGRRGPGGRRWRRRERRRAGRPDGGGADGGQRCTERGCRWRFVRGRGTGPEVTRAHSREASGPLLPGC